MAKFFATTSPEITERETRHMQLVHECATEGIVLLENNGVLPLKTDVRSIALFGVGARYTIPGGTGSGEANGRMMVNVDAGLVAAGYTISTTALLDSYDEQVSAAKQRYVKKLHDAIDEEGTSCIGRILWHERFAPPAMPNLTKQMIEETRGDVAVYVITRNAGEGKDRTPTEGSYCLTPDECANIALLAETYPEKLIVLLNVGGVIDTSYLRQVQGLGALVLLSQPGCSGCYAVGDVFSGKVAPSGCLTSTWAERYEDYPNANTYAHMNGDADDEYYTEGIYVGYRWFDRRNIKPAYAFGYGLSYTTFDLKTEKAEVQNEQIHLEVNVSNTGSQYAGKKVVQVYASAPDGKLDKPYQELVGFAKTGVVAPGASERVCMDIPVERLASYDESRAAWVLEKGDYLLRVGHDSRNTRIGALLHVPEEIITSQLKNFLALDCEMEPLPMSDALAISNPADEEDLASAIRMELYPQDVKTQVCRYSDLHPEIPAAAPGHRITLPEVLAGKYTLDELVSQLTGEEMAMLCVGTARAAGEQKIVGNASAKVPGAGGDTTSLLIDDREIPNIVLADGPAGLRLTRTFAVSDGKALKVEPPFPGMDMAKVAPPLPEDAVLHYQYCTAIPVATMLAQTWNMDLLECMGDLVAVEMEEMKVSLWLAPGMNIHRNPLCGRNFEYYSEDPLVSGMCAAATTVGVQKHKGCGTTLKHFACNNQELNRMHNNAHVSERALREIYLKGFEIAVRNAHPQSIMTSYNLVNGTHTANRRDLLTFIARDEWGFDGIVMTDWCTTFPPNGVRKYGASDTSICMFVGNDLIMPGSRRDVDIILQGLESGSLPLGQLQLCAKRVLRVIMGTM